MYFELPREKVGEAGWAARKSFSCASSGLLRGLKRGVLRLPSTRNAARKLPVVLKNSFRVEMTRQARGRGSVSSRRLSKFSLFHGKGAPLRATIGRSGPSGAPLRTSGCWWSRGPRFSIGRFNTELVIHPIWSDNILALRCPLKDSERFGRCWGPFQSRVRCCEPVVNWLVGFLSFPPYVHFLIRCGDTSTVMTVKCSRAACGAQWRKKALARSSDAQFVPSHETFVGPHVDLSVDPLVGAIHASSTSGTSTGLSDELIGSWGLVANYYWYKEERGFIGVSFTRRNTFLLFSNSKSMNGIPSFHQHQSLFGSRSYCKAWAAITVGTNCKNHQLQMGMGVVLLEVDKRSPVKRIH
eukprot:scaffold1112_cov354-Pavlova_lutheri.AAC.7